jgi:hypothetical protein
MKVKENTRKVYESQGKPNAMRKIPQDASFLVRSIQVLRNFVRRPQFSYASDLARKRYPAFAPLRQGHRRNLHRLGSPSSDPRFGGGETCPSPQPPIHQCASNKPQLKLPSESSVRACTGPRTSSRKGQKSSERSRGFMRSTASFQNFDLEKWAQPLGDLNLARACEIESKDWLCDSRP